MEATHAQDDTVTWEEAHTDGRALVKHDSIEWEDADGNLGGTGEGTPTQDPMQGGTTRQVANPMGDSLPGKGMLRLAALYSTLVFSALLRLWRRPVSSTKSLVGLAVHSESLI